MDENPLVHESALNNLFSSRKKLTIETETGPKFWAPGKREPLRRRQTNDITTGKKRRRRRKAAQIDRAFCCSFPGCGKSYGAEGSLNQHTLLKHRDTFIKNNAKHDRSRSAVTLSRISPSTLQYLHASPVLFAAGSYPGFPVSLNEPETECNSLNNDNKLEDTDDNQTESIDWDDTFIEYDCIISPTIDELLENMPALDDRHDESNNQMEHNDDSLLQSMLLNSNLKYQPLDVDELPPMESEIQKCVNYD